MRHFWIVLAGVSLWMGPSPAVASQEQTNGVGVILVAHGAKGGGWNQLVEQVAQQVRVGHPVEVAFLMNAPAGKTLQDAVARLETRGAQDIIVVPFLVSSCSGHFEEIRYYLGLRPNPPGHVHGGPLTHRARLAITSALDDDPVVAEILLQFAGEISRDPASETVILVAHGPNEDDENQRWMQTLEAFATYLKQKQPFKAVVAVTLRDDAPTPVRDAATQELRRRVFEASQRATALVVPVLISSDFIQKRIRERLQGLSFRMNDKGLSAHPRIAESLGNRVLQGVAKAREGFPVVTSAGGKRSQPGAIEGRVADPTGAAVVAATVRGYSSDGSLMRKSLTDEEGHYVLANLAPGEYTLVALSDDFEGVSATVTVEGTLVHRDLAFTRARATSTSVEVLGKAQEWLQEIPGSAFLVSRQELEQSRPMDTNEVLRRVPGVNLREDSGPVAMRLNIGMRGLNPDRSRQVLILEDGLPVSLAPYGEPEMYYSPPIDRMRGVEVLKGSGQILYGPQTIGGVLNFLTPDPPPTTRGTVDLEGGQRGYFVGQGSIGGSTRGQDAGWLINFLRKHGDGFRRFVFDINDLQTKFTIKPGERHQLGLKLGLYDERSNSTYLGLTTPQFLRDPNENAVPHDLLRLRRKSVSMTHTAVLSPAAVLSTSAFTYNTVRNWRRQNFDRSDRGRAYLAVEGDPRVPGGAVYLLDSNRQRNREFTVAGVQTQFSLEHRFGGLRQKLDTGIRYVYEEADDKEIDAARFDGTTGSLRSDEDRFGRAFSAFAQNRMFLTRKVILTPGVRLERYHYTRHIQRVPVKGVPTDIDVSGNDLVTKLIPGLGLTVNVSSGLTLFTGLHRGFAPPRTKDAIAGDGTPLELDAELSWNYEAGVRFRPRRAVVGEVTFFRLDFGNQIIPAAQSGGATTTLVNAGETLHQGVETSLRVDWGETFRAPFGLYTDFRYTYLPTAKFTRDAVYLGHRLPYAPENIFSFLVGYRHRRNFGVHLDSNFVGEHFADNNQTVTPSADGTIGLIPRYTLWNLTVDYTRRGDRVTVSPYVGVKNLTNAIYISSRAPQGIQPGLFRQVNVGVKLTF